MSYPPPSGPSYPSSDEQSRRNAQYEADYAAWYAQHGQAWASYQSEQGRLQQQHADERRAHPHPVPRPYALMLRTWDYAWWRPVVGVLLGVGVFLAAQVALLVIPFVGVALEHGSGSYGDRLTKALQLKDASPISMLYLNLSLASLVLAAYVAVRVVHRLRFRWLLSVLPGVRWKFFFACLGIGVVALGASLAVGAFLPDDPNGVSGTAHFPTGQLLATAVIILFTTPLQAMGEEFGFRGYLMQAFGSLTDAIAERLGMSARAASLVAQGVALLLTSGLFALAHGAQNFPLFFDRFAFGLIAGLIVLLVGGLEAGIALHILNNLLAFGVAIAFNQLEDSLTVSSASWWQLPVTVVQNGLFLVLVLLVARKMELRRTTEPPAASQVGSPVV